MWGWLVGVLWLEPGGSETGGACVETTVLELTVFILGCNAQNDPQEQRSKRQIPLQERLTAFASFLLQKPCLNFEDSRKGLRKHRANQLAVR